ncbi:MAG: hypothetical protein JWQ72_2344 [Polaromonas sp.]|nr:hypothetical protein [Polaromonas sp.]
MPNVPATRPAPSTHLRHIALTIEEDDPGLFFWVLIESTGDAVVFDKGVSHSEHGYLTYERALDEGVRSLKALCDGKREHGPRTKGEDEGGNPVGEQDGQAV